jgi:hypothetical protein
VHSCQPVTSYRTKPPVNRKLLSRAVDAHLWMAATDCSLEHFFGTHIKVLMSLPQVWNCGRTPAAVCVKWLGSCNTALTYTNKSPAVRSTSIEIIGSNKVVWSQKRANWLFYKFILLKRPLRNQRNAFMASEIQGSFAALRYLWIAQRTSTWRCRQMMYDCFIRLQISN